MATKNGDVYLTELCPLLIRLKKDSSRYAGYLKYNVCHYDKLLFL